VNAIVVGQRGALRDGLIALLYTVPEISVVSATEQYSSALELVKGHTPFFLLLQIDSPGQEYDEWINTIKERAPNTRILALVNDASLMSGCLSAGVDVVLMQGADASKLREAIVALVTPGGNPRTVPTSGSSV
jgi:DNA-binding NarL/FixJ family response regulator